MSSTAPATKPEIAAHAPRTQEDDVGILRERIMTVLPVEKPRTPTSPTLPHNHTNPTKLTKLPNNAFAGKAGFTKKDENNEGEVRLSPPQVRNGLRQAHPLG